jgi:hypothetical protein
LDRNVVLGLFNYGGQDGTKEIDIEFGQWGNPGADRGHYTVWPNEFVAGYSNSTQSFPVSLNGDYTTHRFLWDSDQITFQSTSAVGLDRRPSSLGGAGRGCFGRPCLPSGAGRISL